MESDAPAYCAAAIDNGSGDTSVVFFSEAGCIIKGFDHEYPVSRACDYGEVPPALLSLLEEPFAEKDAVSFCVWRGIGDDDWKHCDGSDEYGEYDGMYFLSEYIRTDSEAYVEWAEEHYGQAIPIPTHIADAVFEENSVLRDALLLRDRAHECSKAGEYEQAVSLCETAAARMMNTDAAAHEGALTASGAAFFVFYELAANRMNLEDFPGAIEAYEQAIRMYPENLHDAYAADDADMQLYYWCGQCRIKIRDWEGAAKDFQQSAASKEPHMADALCALGVASGALKDYANAAAAYEGALEDYYHNSREEAFSMYTPDEAWYGRAACLMALGELKEALRCYREVISLKPDSWKSFELAGLCLNDLGNTALAAKLARISEQKQCGDAGKAIKEISAYLRGGKKKGVFGFFRRPPE
jgi:tetratricopeptide (TPR) repeat protein